MCFFFHAQVFVQPWSIHSALTVSPAPITVQEGIRRAYRAGLAVHQATSSAGPVQPAPPAILPPAASAAPGLIKVAPTPIHAWLAKQDAMRALILPGKVY